MGKFVIKPSAKGVMFNLKASNGEIIASSQVYKTVATCKKGIASVQRIAPVANLEDQTEKDFKQEKNPKFEVYTDKKGETRFRLKASNGQIVATGEGYSTKKACLNGVESVRKNAANSTIEKADK
ncbi:MAG: YegP family protein [Lachnospiraceae bacterium]|nr:YegP family protein [Lachnospiraceae bacterium]